MPFLVSYYQFLLKLNHSYIQTLFKKWNLEHIKCSDSLWWDWLKECLVFREWNGYIDLSRKLSDFVMS